MSGSNVFFLFSEGELLESNYIPLISFASQEQKDRAESFILSEAEDFFGNLLNTSDSVQPIPYYKTISKQDFNQINIEYFYNNLFFNLGERDFSGKLINKPKWGVTFDEELAPIQTAYLSPYFSGNSEEIRLSYSDRREGRQNLAYRTHNPFSSYRKYGFISLNGEPIFYYLYFTIQEVLDALK